MQIDYFKDCYTMADAKQRRGELSKKYHPDIGGDTKTMAEINRQYDEFVPSESDWKQSAFTDQTRSRWDYTSYDGYNHNSFHYNKIKENEDTILSKLKIVALEATIKSLESEVESVKSANKLIHDDLIRECKSNRDLDERNKNLHSFNKRLELRKAEMVKRINDLENQMGCMGDLYHISLWEYLKRRYFNKRKNK